MSLAGTYTSSKLSTTYGLNTDCQLTIKNVKQDIAGNRTTFDYEVIMRNMALGNDNWRGNAMVTITIGGVSIISKARRRYSVHSSTSAATSTTKFYSNMVTDVIASGSSSVAHNASGKFSGVVHLYVLPYVWNHPPTYTNQNVYYWTEPQHSMSLTSASITLADIPRNGVITSVATTEIGQGIVVQMNRPSSTFTTKMGMQVNNVWTTNYFTLKSTTGGVTLMLSDAEWTAVVKNSLSGGVIPASFTVKILIQTYNGATLMGSHSMNGTITRPALPLLAQVSTAAFNIAGGFSFKIDNKASANIPGYKMRAYIANNSGGNVVTADAYNGNVNWAGEKTFTFNSFTTAERNTYRGLLSKSNTGNLRVYLVAQIYGYNIVSNLSIQQPFKEGSPKLNASSSLNLSASERNTTISNLTLGTNVFVSEKSSVRLRIPAGLFTTNYAARIISLVISAGSYSKTISVADLASNVVQDIDMGQYRAVYGSTIRITAQDTWGSSASKTLSVTLRNYSNPSVGFSVRRSDLTSGEVNLNSGRYSPLFSSGNVNKNGITKVAVDVVHAPSGYKYSPETNSPTDANNDGIIEKFGTSVFTRDNLVSTNAYRVTITVTDKLGSYAMPVQTITSWSPLMQIDHVNNSIGLISSTNGEVDTVSIGGKLTVTGTINDKTMDQLDHTKGGGAGNHLGAGYISQGLEKPNWFGSNKLKLQMLSGGNNIVGAPGGWSDVLWMSSYSGSDVKGSNALIFNKTTNAVGYVRQNYDSTTWGSYIRIIDANNINSYTGMSSTGQRITTDSGWISIGSANSNWAHFNTDRPNFYFYKEIYVLGNNNKVIHTGDKPMYHRFALTSGVNLNSYTTAGIYWTDANATAVTMINRVDGNAGILEVLASPGMIYQRWTSYADNSVYTRRLYGGSWTNWSNLKAPTSIKVLTQTQYNSETKSDSVVYIIKG